eukprot:3940790-Rhodomonas_salina.2
MECALLRYGMVLRHCCGMCATGMVVMFSYRMCSTELGYGGTVCHGMCGTEIGYGGGRHREISAGP